MMTTVERAERMLEQMRVNGKRVEINYVDGQWAVTHGFRPESYHTLDEAMAAVRQMCEKLESGGA